MTHELSSDKTEIHVAYNNTVTSDGIEYRMSRLSFWFVRVGYDARNRHLLLIDEDGHERRFIFICCVWDHMGHVTLQLEEYRKNPQYKSHYDRRFDDRRDDFDSGRYESEFNTVNKEVTTAKDGFAFLQLCIDACKEYQLPDWKASVTALEDFRRSVKERLPSYLTVFQNE